MKSYEEMTKEELLKEKEGLEAEYKKFQQRGLKLDKIGRASCRERV